MEGYEIDSDDRHSRIKKRDQKYLDDLDYDPDMRFPAPSPGYAGDRGSSSYREMAYDEYGQHLQQQTEYGYPSGPGAGRATSDRKPRRIGWGAVGVGLED